MTLSLPASKSASVSKLIQIFDNTTSSYKYLFFLSLLDLAGDSTVIGNPPLQTRTVVEGSLAIAWYSHSYFRLSFGRQDLIGKVLSETSMPLFDTETKLSPLDIRTVHEAIHRHLSSRNYGKISRWVQFRLLTPWFRDKLKGLKDQAKNKLIAQLSRTQFDRRTPLYRLVNDMGSQLQIHPSWMKYIQRNYVPLRDWARWQWLQYMQARNSFVPNVAGKLLPPTERASLAKQRKFWTRIIQHSEVRCIFTGRRLSSLDALDHFLPWSFVLHDRMWNLAPITSETNSAKRDNLPALDFLPALATLHTNALVTSHELMGKKTWNDVAFEYVEDLNLTFRDLEAGIHNPGRLRKKLESQYTEVIGSLWRLASRQGFCLDWTPKSD